ncbi:Inherit from biNOG: Family with sequence similarity 173, member B [Seminavis robusta]|uniref:Inherit from biNOG: Family with sequence similarity 173, member B n=1 Tax=Seminavis robusta TaxID=568900 RepID=A0A9N8DMC0_9STRA|nr:Inherit from biNOG: Family with sequence similarity 173, member B [Seminavis robusta]|eukprot:Sro163_g073180.1 Inherit from biNOG: Family with sequence similarity 173, member B (300) ;mRNA; r:45648-46547
MGPRRGVDDHHAPIHHSSAKDMPSENDLALKYPDHGSFHHLATASSSSTNANSPWLGLAIAGTTIVGTLVLTAPFVLQYIRSPLPYMATPKDKVKRALDYVANRRPRLTPTRKRHFVDMGSGDGEAVYQALQQKKQETMLYDSATGIELNSTLWGLAHARRILFWTRAERIRSSFLLQDMFAFHLQHADTVMIFGVKPLMEPISQKLAAELQDGTLVLAYRFPIPLAANEDSEEKDHVGHLEKSTSTTTTTSIDEKSRQARLLTADLVYEEEEMRVYEVKTATEDSSDFPHPKESVEQR